MKWKRKQNKKGILFLEILLVFILIFVFVIVALIATNAYSQFNAEVNQSTDMSPMAKNISNTANESFQVLDNISVFLLVGLSVAIVFFSFLIKVHPIFLFINILLMPVTLIVTIAFSNAYELMVASDALAATSAQMPTMLIMMSKLPYFAVVFSLIVMVVMYGKREW